MSHHKWTLGLLQFHARRSSKSYAYQPRPETAARIMNSSPADVRPTARGVAERPQHEPDPWHDRHISLLAHWTFVSSFPFKPRGLTLMGSQAPWPEWKWCSAPGRGVLFES